MQTATKAKLLRVIAWFCGVAALGLAVLAVMLIKGGAYPPPGTGSLGHVGMVIAGVIAAFLGIFLGGLVLVCASSIRNLDNADKSIPNPGAGE